MAKKRKTLHAVLVEALDAASYSATKLAGDAGLDWSTLAKWKAGTRAPQTSNAADVGRALAAQGRRMVGLGEELAAVATAEASEGEESDTAAAGGDPRGEMERSTTRDAQDS